jgi:hypothetical protein
MESRFTVVRRSDGRIAPRHLRLRANDMTWEELVTLLIETGENVHVVRAEGADAVSLQLPPAGWFVSMKATAELNVGVYEGADNRLVGTRVVALEEVAADGLRAEIAELRAKQFAALFAKDFWPRSSEPPDHPKRW